MKFETAKEIAARVRADLIAAFPGCEFSVRKETYSMGRSIHVALMKAPFEVFDKTHETDKNGNVLRERDTQYAQLNQYTLRNEYEKEGGYCNGSWLTPEAWRVLQGAQKIINKGNWDNSDPQTDYFDVNYYAHLNIGQWNKPFTVSVMPPAKIAARIAKVKMNELKA